MPRRVLVFDVNETLLDLTALDPEFERAFGTASARVQWFQAMLSSAFLATITGRYASFGDHGRAALRQTAERLRMALSPDAERAILGKMRELPPHPEVRGALESLRAAGFRLAALTNSTEEVERAQLQNAGLADLFEVALSADTVKRLKPAPEPYRMAAERLAVGVGDVRLVAAHLWDVAGALAAGCAAAFVARPGALWNELVPKPDVWGADMTEVARQIRERDA